MKTLIAILATVIGTTAYAESTCQVKAASGATVQLSQEDGFVSISHYGISRNTYHALYSVEDCRWNRVGRRCSLVKAQDLSTWQDMPETLELDYGSFSVVLFGLYENPVFFSSKQCPELAEGIEL